MAGFEQISSAGGGVRGWRDIVSSSGRDINAWLADKRGVRSLILFCLERGDDAGLSELAQILAHQAWSSVPLDGSSADRSYLAAFGPIFSDATIEQVCAYNGSVLQEFDFTSLAASLYRHNAALEKYISRAADLFRKRFAAEYSLIQGLSGDLFPYKYIMDYAFAGKERAAPMPKKVKCDFIYCIKNRVQRTSLSLRSLEKALKNYHAQGGETLEIGAIVSEDVSSDTLDLSTVGTNALGIDQYVVDTGVSWTRSGLLNLGIRRSEADLLAFVDADFLFHDSFVTALERVLRVVDHERNVIAVNLIETETHLKNGVAYSKGSPYSYMWMAPARAVKEIDGFDEGYTGHGFEDRDFELKLNRLGKLTVSDTLSYDREAFVLHLSHAVRDGYEKQKENKTRYLRRSDLKDPNDLRQAQWGEFRILRHARGGQTGPSATPITQPAKRKDGVEIFDVLFFPHNRYHARSFLDIRARLSEQNVTSALVRISPPHPEEGAFDEQIADAYVPLQTVLSGEASCRVMVCMNDWENRVVRHAVNLANEIGIPTIGIVEGVNDYKDVDTGFNRTAYRRVRTLLLNGEFDRRYFDGSDQSIHVAGVQRLDDLLRRPRARAKASAGKPRAVINVNFSYGVLADKRDRWLADVISQCEISGYEVILSQHIADSGTLHGHQASKRPLYDLLETADVFVSRFSGAILEALVLGTNVIYYNPQTEKIDKFNEPLGAYLAAESPLALSDALRKFRSGHRCDPTAFLALHCCIPDERRRAAEENLSLPKTADLIRSVVRRAPPVDHKEFTRALAGQYAKRCSHIAQPAPDLQKTLLEKTTFGIKSFGRTVHLASLVNSILGLFPDARIMVVDDSGMDIGLPKQVKLIKTPEIDIGLSTGRNILVDKCETEYFVLLDDDFILTERTNIMAMIGTLVQRDLDIVGAAVYDVGPSAQKKDQPRTFYGCIDLDSSGKLTISTGKIRGWHNAAPLYDLVLNFFAARTEVLRSVRWSDALKLGEHLDFFLRAKAAGVKISYLHNCMIDHYRNHSANTEEYKAYRRRADDYHGQFKAMYGINRIYLNNDEIPG